VTSVAYEELALSHILNAEGEKIQYALGTLPGNPNEATIDDVLDVNESVGSMLDTVLDNQMVLSSKLTSALSATTSGGVTGATGATGAIGSATGLPGTAGPKGTTGQTGAKGDLGAMGPQGAAGAAGISAANGSTGATGVAGVVGAVGLQGAIGARGADVGAVEIYGSAWATGRKTFNLTANTPTDALEIDESATDGMTITVGVIELDSIGYYLISYRLVFEEPIVARTYILQSDGATVDSSVINEDFSDDLLVYEKKFIAAVTDTELYLMLESNANITATTAPGGIVFTATRLADVVFVTGPTGPTGPTGAPGPQGAMGETGATGAAGQTGAKGALGETGATGAAGAAGVSAANGATGATGVAGATGIPGLTGAMGATGTDVGAIEIYSNGWATGSKIFTLTENTPTDALIIDESIESGLFSPGYYLISYRLVFETPIVARTYMYDANATVIEASFVNEYYEENLLVYEKQFIARYEENGFYLALESNADISATTAPGGIALNVIKLGDIHLYLTPHTNYLAYHETLTHPELVTVTTDPPGQAVTWSSSDPTIATVDASGNVTGVGEGTVTITANLNGEMVSYELNTFETIALAGGTGHTLALKSNGTVWAQGYNGGGQLGDNTTTDRHTPVQTENLTVVISIAAGYFHSLALQSDGIVWAWGGNGNGQLGDNTITNRYTPVQTENLTDVISIAAGYGHSLALQSDGIVWAWGDN
jgi:hypothetical protein